MNLLLIAIKLQGFSGSPLAACVACPAWELLTQMCAGGVVVLLMAAQCARPGSSRHFTSRSGSWGSPWGEPVGFQLAELSTGCANVSERWSWGQPWDGQGSPWP